MLGYGQQKNPETVCAVFLEKLQLPERLTVITDFGFIDGEVTMPEESDFFFKGAFGGEHPVRPPVTDALGFQDTRTQPIEELVDDRLKRAIASRLYFNSERFAFFFGHLRHGRPALRKRFEARIVNPR